jgi:hypothetical protein
VETQQAETHQVEILLMAQTAVRVDKAGKARMDKDHRAAKEVKVETVETEVKVEMVETEVKVETVETEVKVETEAMEEMPAPPPTPPQQTP